MNAGVLPVVRFGGMRRIHRDKLLEILTAELIEPRIDVDEEGTTRWLMPAGWRDAQAEPRVRK
jgi:hypothetical protein